MLRSLRVLAAIGVIALPLALTTAAGAQACSELDVVCAAGQVDDDARAPGDTAGHVGDAAPGPVHDASGAAQGAADDAEGAVRDTIDDTLVRNVQPPPDGDDGADGGDAGRDGKRGGSEGVHDAGHRQHVRSKAPQQVGASRRDAASQAASPSSGPGAGPGPGGDTPGHPTDRGSSATIGHVAAGVVGGVVMMAVLLGAVVAFLAVQDRLDRRDPKLAAAAIGSDRVRFT